MERAGTTQGAHRQQLVDLEKYVVVGWEKGNSCSLKVSSLACAAAPVLSDTSGLSQYLGVSAALESLIQWCVLYVEGNGFTQEETGATAFARTVPTMYQSLLLVAPAALQVLSCQLCVSVSYVSRAAAATRSRTRWTWSEHAARPMPSAATGHRAGGLAHAPRRPVPILRLGNWKSHYWFSLQQKSLSSFSNFFFSFYFMMCRRGILKLGPSSTEFDYDIEAPKTDLQVYTFPCACCHACVRKKNC